MDSPSDILTYRQQINFLKDPPPRTIFLGLNRHNTHSYYFFIHYAIRLDGYVYTLHTKEILTDGTEGKK